MWHLREKTWFIQGFFVEKTEKRDHLEDLGVDGGVNIECTFKKRWDSMNWIDLAQIRGQMGSFRFFNGEN